MCPLCDSRERDEVATIKGRCYWGCRQCGLVALDARHYLTAAAEKSHYQSHENNPKDPRYRQFLSRLLDPLLPYLPRGAQGLDYGSGPGPTLSLMFAERGFAMSIYDPYFAPDAAVLQRQYDFITCSETAEHFNEPAAEFARLEQCLRPGGWLGIMTQLLMPETDFASWWYHRDPTHVAFYRPQTMGWLAAYYGWRVELPAPNIALFQKPFNQ